MFSTRAGTLATVCAFFLLPSALFAQSVPPSPAASDGTTFLPRTEFEFSWASLIATDRRFDWEGRIGIDFDIVDYGAGRLSFRADYGAVLGRERRRYDLNQGNYLFEAASSWRVRQVELVALIAHVSRHLVDRDQEPAISWNTSGVRVRYDTPTIESHVELTWPTQKAFVDYTWISKARVDVTRPVNRRVSLLASAYGDVYGVDHTKRDRRVCGGFIEGAVRINGRTAAVEVFAGYERRVDAYPTDRYRVRMFMVGFRVKSN